MQLHASSAHSMHVSWKLRRLPEPIDLRGPAVSYFLGAASIMVATLVAYHLLPSLEFVQLHVLMPGELHLCLKVSLAAQICTEQDRQQDADQQCLSAEQGDLVVTPQTAPLESVEEGSAEQHQPLLATSVPDTGPSVERRSPGPATLVRESLRCESSGRNSPCCLQRYHADEFPVHSAAAALAQCMAGCRAPCCKGDDYNLCSAAVSD